MKRVALIGAVLAFGLTAVDVEAQGRRVWKEWYGHFQGGWSMPMGDADDIAKDGWALEGGATYRPDGGPLGLWGSLGFMDHDMTREVLEYFESSGGDISVWYLTTGVSYEFDLSPSFDIGISAGIGGYNVEGRLIEPGRICGPICDPWYWWVCVPGCVPGDVVTDSESTTKFGYNLGVELAFDVGVTTQVYLQARYHVINTKEATELLPISIGVRF